VKPQAESRRQPARYLDGKLVTVIEADRGGHAVTFAAAQPGRRSAR
jgi:hypothetical protein